jgi:hypothetical protein
VRAFAGLTALLFAYSAIVQYNDPDPLRWIALYGCAAVLSAGAIFEATPRPMLLALACAAGIWAVTIVPVVASERDFTGTEEERELLGLAIVAASSAALWRLSRR